MGTKRWTNWIGRILERGLHGVTITSQVGGLFLDSPELDRFYERVARLDVPIFVHPALVPKGYDSIQGYDLPRIIGREIDLTIATIRLIAGGVLDRHPEIDFVIGHFGGGIAAFKDRLVAMAHRFGTLKRPFEEYLDRLYFDISGFEGGITAFPLRAARHPPGTACVRHGLSAELHRREHGDRQGQPGHPRIHRSGQESGA